MKNHAKKVFAVVIALMLVAVSVFPAFAQERNYTITLTPSIGESTTTFDNNRFEAYQIFTGDVTETWVENQKKATLADIKWGAGITDDFVKAFIAELKKTSLNDAVEEALGTFTFDGSDATSYTDSHVAAAIAGILDKKGWDGAEARAFAKAVDEAITTYNKTASTKLVPVAKNTGNSITVNKAGYYLIKDTATFTTDPTSDATSSLMLSVVKDVTMKVKNDLPTIEKKIDEGNGVDGTTAETSGTVSFKLTATLPSNYSDFDDYYFLITDKPTNLTIIKDSVKVYVGENEVTGDFTISVSEGTLTILCNNLKAATNAAKYGDSVVITVKYNATLNKDAKLGYKSDTKLSENQNEVDLTYSNNPNGKQHGTTEDDKTYVYTFGLDITKKSTKQNDGQDVLLAGAEFVLKDGTGSNAKYAEFEQDSTGAYKLVGWATTKTAKTKLVTGTDDKLGKLLVDGLKAGTYYLEETKAPAGYNTIEGDITVVITATPDTNGAMTTAPTISVSNSTESGSVGTGAAYDVNDGRFDITLLDTPATELPGTGGMGTTIFYIVGATMLAVALIVLVATKAKKKVTE